MIRDAIAALVEGRDLTEEEAAGCMEEIMSGEATPAQFGAFVVALRLKGETVDEIAGMARVMREKALRVSVDGPLLDTCIARAGFGFMFAPAFHPAMKFAAGPRREIGVRTVFNILGPLTNPAGATRQLLGVARPELAPEMAGVLLRLGSEHALVVHGEDGLDELSLSAESTVH